MYVVDVSLGCFYCFGVGGVVGYCFVGLESLGCGGGVCCVECCGGVVVVPVVLGCGCYGGVVVGYYLGVPGFCLVCEDVVGGFVYGSVVVGCCHCLLFRLVGCWC